MNDITITLTESYITTSWHTRFDPTWDWWDFNRWEIITDQNGQEVLNSKQYELQSRAQVLINNLTNVIMYGFNSRLDAYIFSRYINQSVNHPNTNALVVNDAVNGDYWVVSGERT